MESAGAWGEDLRLEPASVPASVNAPETEPHAGRTAPTHGIAPWAARAKESLVAGHHAAVGDFEAALRLLQKQIALADPAPLKAAFVRAAKSARVRLSLVPGISKLNYVQLIGKNGLPLSPLSLACVTAIFKVNLDRRPGRED